jgi:peptidoglycan-associated lipoprotein
MAGKLIPQEFLEKEVTDTVMYVDLKLQRFENELTKFDISLLYDYNKWDIRPDAARVLDGVIQFLKDNPEVLIELGSHTDSRGSFTDNELLAQRRAQSAVDYIVSKGKFNRDKIAPKGYGENTPKTIDKDFSEKYEFVKEGDILTESFINTFKDEKRREILHQFNRRTEIRITGVE